MRVKSWHVPRGPWPVVIIAAALLMGTASLAAEADAKDYDADDYCRMGQACFERGEYEEALQWYERGLALDPADNDLYRYKAEILVELGRYDEAARTLTRAAEMGPEDADWYADRGFRIFADNIRDGCEYEKAAVYFDAALALDPNNAVALKLNGTALTMMGKYDDALECYDRVLALNANDGGAWALKGRTLLYVGEAETALRCFERELELDAIERLDWQLRGVAYFMLDDYAQGRAAFEKAFSAVGGGEDDLLYLYVVDRADGRAGVERLRPILESPCEAWRGDIARFLAGEIDAEDLLTKAGADKISLCEDHCYIGYKCKFDGDDDAARRHFEEAVATGAGWPPEYILSLHELRRLEAAGN